MSYTFHIFLLRTNKSRCNYQIYNFTSNTLLSLLNSYENINYFKPYSELRRNNVTKVYKCQNYTPRSNKVKPKTDFNRTRI